MIHLLSFIFVVVVVVVVVVAVKLTLCKKHTSPPRARTFGYCCAGRCLPSRRWAGVRAVGVRRLRRGWGGGEEGSNLGVCIYCIFVCVYVHEFLYV